MTTGVQDAAAVPAARPAWRSVAIPNEHGGWGLTLEPVLLGLLVRPSLAGVLIGIAALLAFLVRTPLKLITIDRRHHRWIDRSRLASRVAAIELAAIAALGALAIASSGWSFLLPALAAAPLVAVEWSYDSRGRGRRLVPELCGATGIAAVAAAIVVAGDGASGLAAACWSILTARSVGSIPFVRVQIARLRRGTGTVWHSDVAQVAALAGAVVAVALDRRFVVGALVVVLIVALQVWWVRRPPVPPKRLGFTQLGLGVGLAVATALGVLLG